MAILPPMPLRRLTVAQYRAMADAGILTHEDRTELLDGLLVEKSARRPLDRISTYLCRDALAGAIPAGWYVDTQEPIVTADSEPEPDAAVIRGATEDYTDQNPPASAVGLVVEVADTSVATDRDVKGGIYARAGIPAYWIVNLVDRVVEVYEQPTGAGAAAHYASRTERRPGAQLVLTLDGVPCAPIAVDDILP